MATLAFVLARLFDPAQAGLVLAVVLAYRGPQPIVVAAAVAAVVSETVTLAAAVDYAWGERLLLRLAACLAQAAALARLVGVIRLARPGAGDGPRAERLGKATAALGSAADGLAPWHMRAYVRRRVRRLRKR